MDIKQPQRRTFNGLRVGESNGHGELFKSPVAKISSLREETVDLVQQVNAVAWVSMYREREV